MKINNTDTDSNNAIQCVSRIIILCDENKVQTVASDVLSSGLMRYYDIEVVSYYDYNQRPETEKKQEIINNTIDVHKMD